MPVYRALLVLTASALLAGGCAGSVGAERTGDTPVPPTPSTTTTIPTTTTTAPTTTTSLFARLPERVVVDQAWTPMVTVGGVTLVHPSARVEHVGFHESNNDAARPLEPLPTAVDPVVLESRERGTDPRTAADVVVDPNVEIRAPVTGTVLRAGRYTLYCDYSDDFAVIEPDDHPGWEVKILHIDDVQVARGDRVVAGETVVAPRPTLLPFPSQVDELATAKPAWPHVHIEVVDPSLPDRPGTGC
jgi:hypothetical protein